MDHAVTGEDMARWPESRAFRGVVRFVGGSGTDGGAPAAALSALSGLSSGAGHAERFRYARTSAAARPLFGRTAVAAWLITFKRLW
jgi:hypothetical protein